jgi:hypothetical protein
MRWSAKRNLALPASRIEGHLAPELADCTKVFDAREPASAVACRSEQPAILTAETPD